MAKTEGIGLRLPRNERNDLERLVVALGVTRSVLIRAAVADLAVRDLASIRERVEALPTLPIGRPTREARAAALEPC